MHGRGCAYMRNNWLRQRDMAARTGRLGATGPSDRREKRDRGKARSPTWIAPGGAFLSGGGQSGKKLDGRIAGKSVGAENTVDQ
jgi:hypothetical protein